MKMKTTRVSDAQANANIREFLRSWGRYSLGTIPVSVGLVVGLANSEALTQTLNISESTLETIVAYVGVPDLAMMGVGIICLVGKRKLDRWTGSGHFAPKDQAPEA